MMPYRRLPTTDKARLRALEAALKMAAESSSGQLAFSKNTLQKLSEIKSRFENHLKHHELDLKIETEKNIKYKASFDKAKLYVSHFIQVLYMNMERGELKEESLVFYQFDVMDKKLPPLTTEQEILEWGKKIITGEQKRMERGGSPVYNPSIALVKVNVEDFHETAIFQSNLKKNSLRSFEKIQRLRKETNEFISQLWNEIEESADGLSPTQKRQHAEEYGVVYVFRRKEKKKLKTQGMQIDLLFEFH